MRWVIPNLPKARFVQRVDLEQMKMEDSRLKTYYVQHGKLKTNQTNKQQLLPQQQNKQTSKQKTHLQTGILF